MAGRKPPNQDLLSTSRIHRRVEAMARAANTSASDQDLLEGARRLLRSRFQMDRLIPKDLQRHPTWNILTELYVTEREGGLARVKDLMIASGEKPATAVRLIDRLEEEGLIRRERDELDRRCINVRLTENGWLTISELLSHIFGPDQETSSDGPVAFKPRRFTE